MLNGSREGLFLAAIAAARWVSGRARPAGDADAQSVLCRLCGRRGRGRLRAGLSAGNRAPPASCPISTRFPRTCWRAPSRSIIASPANPQGAVADLAYLARLVALARTLRLPGVQRRVLFARSTRRRRRAGMLEAGGAGLRQCGRVPVAVEALEPAGAARRLCGRRPDLPRALSRIAQRRSAAGAGADAARRDRRLWRRGACRGQPPALFGRNSISPTRSSATATAIAGRPAASSSGSTFRRMAATRRSTLRLWQRSGAAGRARPLSGARAGRRQQSGPRLYPRRMVHDQRDHRRGAASPRRGAGLRAARCRSIDRGSRQSGLPFRRIARRVAPAAARIGGSR